MWLPAGCPEGKQAEGMLPASCAISPVTRRNYFILLQVLKKENSNSSQGVPILAASPFPISLHENDAAGGKKTQSELC